MRRGPTIVAMTGPVVMTMLLALFATGTGCASGAGKQPGPPATAAVEADPGSGPVDSTAEATGEADAGSGNVEPAAAASWTLPTPDLGYNAREGRALFQYYCATCHGEEGHGDGLNAYNLDPKPRDLADPAFQSKRTDGDILAVLRSGGAVAGLTTGMPPWGRTLNERQLQNLVDYIRSLVTNPNPNEP